MLRQFARRFLGLGRSFALATLIAGGVGGTAFANDVDTTITKPERNIVDPLGIDIASAQYVREDTLLSIGDPANGGLVWRYVPGASSYLGLVSTQNTKPTIVKIEGNATTFLINGSTYINGSGTGATLVQTATTYVFTADDGTVYTFDRFTPTIDSPSQATMRLNVAKLHTILRPNGDLITITYSTSIVIQSVVSNRGYALKYSGTSPITISAINLSKHVCDASLNCDGYDNSITYLRAAANSSAPWGTADKVTDALGNSWWYYVAESYDYVNPRTLAESEGPLALQYFQSPDGASVKVAYDTAGRITSFVDPRGTFTFDYNGQTTDQARGNWTRTVSVKDPSGALLYTANFTAQAVMAWMKDALGRQTTYNFATYQPASGSMNSIYTRLLSVTKPEGNYVSYTYDTRGNVTPVVVTPKSGSPLAATSVTAGYDPSCGIPVKCNQPNWTKDAKGNQTDYTYDATHGGVLTVTAPADQNGRRRRTYNTYTAFDTGNGTVYRLTRSDTCGLSSTQLALTACPSTTTIAVTTIDYGNATTAPATYKSSLPYATTQTDGPGSVSATTTYTYDTVGNIVAVDGPRTDVTDITYKTYDADRRVIFEIGVLPGGTGSPHRSVVKHTYDGDGHETRTEFGYAGTDHTDGSDFVVTSFKRMTYDIVGRLVKSEEVLP